VWIRFQAQRLNLLQFLLTLMKLLARLKLQRKILSNIAGEYSGQRCKSARNASQNGLMRLYSRIGSQRRPARDRINLILAL
jgi:hypothetical protein